MQHSSFRHKQLFLSWLSQNDAEIKVGMISNLKNAKAPSLSSWKSFLKMDEWKKEEIPLLKKLLFVGFFFPLCLCVCVCVCVFYQRYIITSYPKLFWLGFSLRANCKNNLICLLRFSFSLIGCILWCDVGFLVM